MVPARSSARLPGTQEDSMRPVRALLLATFSLSCASHSAVAETYPSHPITMIAPFAAGAPVDVVGRVIAERMRTALGQPIVVENISGGAGSVGGTRPRAPPGGRHTIRPGNARPHLPRERTGPPPVVGVQGFGP